MGEREKGGLEIEREGSKERKRGKVKKESVLTFYFKIVCSKEEAT